MNDSKTPFEIDYKVIMDLGFKETLIEDKVYFNQYGYQYAIIQKKLGKGIYLEWEKETRVCMLKRIDKDHTIQATITIENMEMLMTIINFFTAKK